MRDFSNIDRKVFIGINNWYWIIEGKRIDKLIECISYLMSKCNFTAREAKDYIESLPFEHEIK